MTDILLIAGNQLFPVERLTKHRRAVILMCESERLCSRLPFHQQKLAFVLSAMRRHAAVLADAGFDVRYHTLADGVDFEDALPALAADVNAGRLVHFDSEDRGFTARIAGIARRLGLARETLDNPLFLLDGETVDEYFRDAKQPRMAAFYRAQRLRLKLLVEDGRPLGGRWSFDAQNRHKLPAGQGIPELPAVRHDRHTREVMDIVAVRFPEHPGRAHDLWLPTDRNGALDWLDRFLEERLTGFGTFEDAISTRAPVLFHSALSPLLNVGLITPDEVVDSALAAGEAHAVPLNDLEGFLRQIIGWREFVRGAYRRHRHSMRRRNVWGGTRRLTDEWLNGETGLPPLDEAIRGALARGWNHHIERLMVIANLMNLAEIHPHDVYRFFMTHYLDAYDWVMVPNVYGMGLASDGGIFTTKPYVCGSNYLRRMSDHPGGEWTEVVDGLYWRFVAKHRRVLASNPRLAVMTRALDRLDRRRLARIFERAERFIGDTTRQAA